MIYKVLGLRFLLSPWLVLGPQVNSGWSLLLITTTIARARTSDSSSDVASIPDNVYAAIIGSSVCLLLQLVYLNLVCLVMKNIRMLSFHTPKICLLNLLLVCYLTLLFAIDCCLFVRRMESSCTLAGCCRLITCLLARIAWLVVVRVLFPPNGIRTYLPVDFIVGKLMITMSLTRRCWKF